MTLYTFYKLFYRHRFIKAKKIFKIYLTLTFLIKYLINLLFLPSKKNLDKISKKNQFLYEKDLNFLFEYFNSDKGLSYTDQYVQPVKKNNIRIEAHGYSSFYEKYFSPQKKKNCNILELGSFYGNAAAAMYFFFKNSKIYSGDIFPDLFRYKSERIKNFYIDTSEEKSINTFVKKQQIEFDIIIEDAGHFFKHQIISLFILFKTLKSKGLFVIEELDFPDTRLDMNINNEKPTLRSILLSIKENKDFKSQYILDEQKKYFLNHFNSIEIYKGLKNEIAFITKK